MSAGTGRSRGHRARSPQHIRHARIVQCDAGFQDLRPDLGFGEQGEELAERHVPLPHHFPSPHVVPDVPREALVPAAAQRSEEEDIGGPAGSASQQPDSMRPVQEASSVQHHVASSQSAPPLLREVVDPAHEEWRRWARRLPRATTAAVAAGAVTARRIFAAEAAEPAVHQRAQSLHQPGVACPLWLQEDLFWHLFAMHQELHQLIREVVAITPQHIVRLRIVFYIQVGADELYQLVSRPERPAQTQDSSWLAEGRLAEIRLQDDTSEPKLLAEDPNACMPHTFEASASQQRRGHPAGHALGQVV
mmetsp:Transcript_174426/g.559147  ORF Transcript_174426/g.559147 Transcript_174426/m.559147 type:complete len:305 (-) Transcript_174426:1330-2244(-)